MLQLLQAQWKERLKPIVQVECLVAENGMPMRERHDYKRWNEPAATPSSACVIQVRSLLQLASRLLGLFIPGTIPLKDLVGDTTALGKSVSTCYKIALVFAPISFRFQQAIRE